jgi:hypothetical protein
MSEEKLSKLEKKKQELENELANIQNGLDKSIDSVKEGVSDNMDPKNVIKKYPLPIVGASLVVGFLLGRNKSTSSVSASKKYSSSSDSAISKEIKRMLAKKGLSLFLDFLDGKVASLKEKQRDTDD